MARVITGDLSIVSGKVGDKVYVKGKWGIYVRKAPTVRSNARTAAMLLNQQRFACISMFCVPFKHSLISMIWNAATTRGSGYNAFLKANSPAFAKDGRLADPLLLKFSKGELALPDALRARRTAPEANIIQIDWQKETHISGLRSGDELMAISYQASGFSPLMATGIQRKDQEGTFVLPAVNQYAQYLFLFFASEDRHCFSDSRGFKI